MRKWNKEEERRYKKNEGELPKGSRQKEQKRKTNIKYAAKNGPKESISYTI